MRKKGGMGDSYFLYLCTGIAGTKGMLMRKDFEVLVKATFAALICKSTELASMSRKAAGATVLLAVIMITSDPIKPTSMPRQNMLQSAVQRG